MTVKMALSSSEEYNLDQEVIFLQVFLGWVRSEEYKFGLFEKFSHLG